MLAFVGVQIASDIQYRFVRNEPQSNFDQFADLDRQLTQAAPHDGLFLQFEGFDTSRDIPSRIFNYALYKLYPKPVLVGDPSQLARSPGEVLAANTPVRNNQWLREHQIGSVLTITNEGDGQFSSEIDWVPGGAAGKPIANVRQTHGGWAGAVYLLCCFIMGYAVVSFFVGQTSICETFGLSAVLGPGIMGLSLIALSMTGIIPSRLDILLCTMPFAVVALLRLHTARNTNPPENHPPTSGAWPISLSGIAILATACGLFRSTIIALRDPIVEWDAFSIWQYKAKLLTLLPLRPQPAYFSTICLSQTHLRYPILAPIISAGHNAMAGGFDSFARAPSLLLLAGLGLAIFSCIDRATGRLPALIATALMLNLSTFDRWAGAGTAEMALTAFYGCSVICLLRWRQSHRWGDLFLTALFSTCMAWSKNEGLALAAINFFFLFNRSGAEKEKRRTRRREEREGTREEERKISTMSTKGTKEGKTNSNPLLRVLRALHGYLPLLVPAAAFALIVAILFSPWQWYIRNLPRTDEDYAGRLTISGILANTSRLPAIFCGLMVEPLNWHHWGIFWPLLAILSVAALFQRPVPGVRTLWLLLLLHLLAYVPPFMVTNWAIPDLMQATTDRLTMHMVPVAALLIGLLLPARISDSSFSGS